ncbi:MAG TPA: hypothetical protein GXZ78_04075 [Eubacteriaceae bacterium]|nr:hypothetical protein [Eubacteriaceae bacterium]
MSGFNYIDEDQVRRAEEFNHINTVEEDIEVKKASQVVKNKKEDDFKIKHFWIRTL